MHRQATDIAAGKEQRRDDMAIGGHYQPTGRNGKLGAIILSAQPFIIESGEEQFFDQLRHRSAAAAVGHFDATVRDIQAAGK